MSVTVCQTTWCNTSEDGPLHPTLKKLLIKVYETIFLLLQEPKFQIRWKFVVYVRLQSIVNQIEEVIVGWTCSLDMEMDFVQNFEKELFENNLEDGDR
jgi:hypothetical protein